MTLEGTVKNGLIVLDPPATLPEGARVKVVVGPIDKKPTLRERLLKLAGTVHDLPTDMARNHDHYTHRAPRERDRSCHHHFPE